MTTRCDQHGCPDRTACCPPVDARGWLRKLEALSLAEQAAIVRRPLERVLDGRGTLDDKHMLDMVAAIWTRREQAA